ncbi:hypothetical protein D3C87_175100 [compost metagenome]
MKNAKQNMMTALSLLMASSMLISCTKEIPYKEVFKEKVHTKSEIDTTSEYLYVASSDTASSDDLGAANALPYWQGTEKIVKFRFTEKSLQAVEVNEESRLKDNKLNEKILIEIPISHIEYRCAEDSYKKCTNREEENSEITWSKKSKFKPNFDELKSVGLSMLPIEMDKVFGGSCYTEGSSRFLNYELTKDSLNIQVEKSFTANVECLAEQGIGISSLNDLQSQIIYHYSFSKLKSVASAKYEAIPYPLEDEGSFGFFNTEFNRYDVDYNRTEKGKTVLMNRWNPDRKEIVYYLSDNFDKPELASMKKATELAFERVNNGLKAAGMDTRLVLKGTGKKQPGDLRNSMIVLVEDPIAAGPLGYGPTVTNPRTGEIISGRVAMYYGNMLQNIKYTYDEVIRELRYANANAAKQQASGGTTDPTVGAPADELFSARLKHQTKMTEYLQTTTANKVGKKITASYKGSNSKVTAQSQYAKPIAVAQISKMSKTAFNKATLQVNKSSAAEDVLAAMSKHCNYPAELFPFDEAVKNGLQSKLGEDLKPWEQLSASEKQEVIALIGPEIWLPTLIHELGHNLGLRHNFGGSEDKANFYTKEELAQMSVKHEVPYSSVMDYGYSELNLLPTLGKYDIAALRFGYKREVTARSGETLKVKTTLAALKKEVGTTATGESNLKAFNFCTDEHVDVNPNCKRFDKGTTLSEIADHMIKQYNDLYRARNFRNGRESFSKMSDATYAAGIRARFNHLRAFMERYESLKYRFRLADDAKEWEDIEFLKDLKQAALKSGRFFMDVLQTPDVTCAVAETSDLTKIVGVERLDNIDASAMNCFGLELKPGIKIIAQYGKSFNHRKDPKSENIYADQIDVRGFFLDKMVAAETLFKRRTGNSSYDQNQDNYLDIAELTPEITNTVNNILLNNVAPVVDFKDAYGNVVFTGKAPAAMFSSPSSKKEAATSHWIAPSLTAGLARALGLPTHAISFQQVLLNTMNNHMSSSKDHWQEDRAFMDQYRVYKTLKSSQLDRSENPAVKDIGSIRLSALPENSLAQELIALSDMVEKLEKLTKEQVQQLLNEKNEVQKLAAAGQKTMTFQPQFSVELHKIPTQIIQIFAQGAFDSDHLNYLATILPDAQ